VDILLARMAQGEKYHTLRDVLRASLGGVASPAAFVVAAVDNLSARTQPDGSLSVPLFHMCLEALAGVEPWARPPYTGPSTSPRCDTSAAAAVQLLAQAVMHPPARAIEPRAVLRLAQTFRLTHADCDAMPCLHDASDAYALRLLQVGHHNAAVLLALQLRLPSVAHAGTLATLLAANAESLAETLAGELGREAQIELVHLCLDDRRFKAAVRACRRFDLHSTFPQAESLYTAATVSRLAAKGTWDVAAAIAQRSVPAQRQLIQAAVDCGEAAVAFELVGRFNLTHEWDAAALSAAAEDAAASDLETYLQLGVDLHTAVLFVDAPHQLAAVASALRGATALGLDAEWRSETVRPVGGRSDEDGDEAKSRVALLQLATATHVFLLDLPALATSCPALLSETLEGALGGPLLLGVGVAQDLAKCAADWPAVPAFASTSARPVDLRLAWRAARGEDAPPGGLAGAARAALGKPLDKRPRMSDWERRPLSETQRRYAANDAHAALRIWHFLTAGMGEQQIEQLAQAVRSPQGPTARAARGPAATRADTAGDDELLPALGTPAVEAALLDSALPWRLVRTAQEGPTCASAAAALGVHVIRIVKSLGLVLNDSSCVLLLLAGDQRADLHAVAATLGVQRRQLRFATADECVQLFGHAPGSMPPVGHRSALRTIMDLELFNRASSDALRMIDADVDSGSATADDGVVYAGAGATDMHLAMHVADMRSAASAELAAIATRTAGGPTDPPAPGAAGGSAQQASPPVDAGPLAFVVDGALGKLGRWLRCLGVDVTCLAENESPQTLGNDQLRGRVLLTRSRTAMAHVPATSVFYVGDGDPRDQLGRVRQRFGLAFQPERLLSRCAACNGVVEVRRSAEEVQLDASVPDHVKRSVTEFWACSTCGKTFWVGPKSRRAVELAASLCAESVYGHPLDGQCAPASDGLAEQIADVLRAFQPRDEGVADAFAFAR
jgi:uncharacterized protein with PIN domain/prolyl-tRNA editing enzyme YbaK/EbsC (Cys-tRNA(Pro) deacylase)